VRSFQRSGLEWGKSFLKIVDCAKRLPVSIFIFTAESKPHLLKSGATHNTSQRTGDTVEHLPNKCEVPGSISSTKKEKDKKRHPIRRSPV
jgi:hypothetical protein